MSLAPLEQSNQGLFRNRPTPPTRIAKSHHRCMRGAFAHRNRSTRCKSRLQRSHASHGNICLHLSLFAIQPHSSQTKVNPRAYECANLKKNEFQCTQSVAATRTPWSGVLRRAHSPTDRRLCSQAEKTSRVVPIIAITTLGVLNVCWQAVARTQIRLAN